jgi:hypothetical protein
VAPRNRRRPTIVRRAERDLFFRTARETVKLIVWTLLTAYFVISLVVRGRIAGSTELLDVAAKVTSLFG